MKPQTTFASVLTRFFTQRLMAQRHVSPHTIHSYRDTFRLLLRAVAKYALRSPGGVGLNWCTTFTSSKAK
jgi:site-specific recombinase XerC